MFVPLIDNLKHVFFIYRTWKRLDNREDIQILIHILNDYYRHYYDLTSGTPREPLPDVEEREQLVRHIYKERKRQQRISSRRPSSRTDYPSPREPVDQQHQGAVSVVGDVSAQRTPDKQTVVAQQGDTQIQHATNPPEDMSKRQRLDSGNADDDPEENTTAGGSITKAFDLFKVHYYKTRCCAITVCLSGICCADTDEDVPWCCWLMDSPYVASDDAN
ncbi:unnamed protein product [Echinostoma caproni]|uniref:Nitrogenase n=1 Tax=Echinostoma caproni TaxID=27848 RepID=A0A183ADP4_9TREM|nr:unnamed protein product [Echinostoma caproni]